MNQYLILGIGLTAQLFFSARLIIQWILSEKANKVLSPTIFWQLSMIASLLLCIYGWLRNDFAIIAGQLISYYIYIWNLRIKDAWLTFPFFLRNLFIWLPVIAVINVIMQGSENYIHFFEQENIPLWLILFGLTGQFTFTLRFIYQWLYSRKAGESALPLPFWIISLSGSLLIIMYAVLRKDPVLIIGQSTGFFVYARNIFIAKKNYSVNLADRQ